MSECPSEDMAGDGSQEIRPPSLGRAMPYLVSRRSQDRTLWAVADNVATSVILVIARAARTQPHDVITKQAVTITRRRLLLVHLHSHNYTLSYTSVTSLPFIGQDTRPRIP